MAQKQTQVNIKMLVHNNDNTNQWIKEGQLINVISSSQN